MEEEICSFDTGWVKYDPDTSTYHLFDNQTHRHYLFDAPELPIGQKCSNCYHFTSSMPIATENGWCEYLDHITRSNRYCSDFCSKRDYV